MLPHSARLTARLTVFALLPAATLLLHAQGAPRDTRPSEAGALPPKTWVDKDTGHRVWRISDEPNSAPSTSTSTPSPPTAGRWSTPPPAASWCSILPPCRAKSSSPMLPRHPTPQPADAAAAQRAPSSSATGPTASSSLAPTPPPASTPSIKPDTNTGAITRLLDLRSAHLHSPEIQPIADETLGAGTYNESDCPGHDQRAQRLPPCTSLRGTGGVVGPAAQPAPAAAPAPGQTPNANAANPTLGGANAQSGRQRRHDGAPSRRAHSSSSSPSASSPARTAKRPATSARCSTLPTGSITCSSPLPIPTCLRTEARACGKRSTASGSSTPTAPATPSSTSAPWPWRSPATSSGDSTARPSGTTGSIPKVKDLFLASYNLELTNASPTTCSATIGQSTSTSPRI